MENINVSHLAERTFPFFEMTNINTMLI